MDLASPRDVETAIGRNPQALLINLDSLNEIVETNRKQREELVQKGQRMIEEAIGETRNGWQRPVSMRRSPAAAALYGNCRGQLCISKPQTGSEYEGSENCKKILKASLKRLIREPILELKQTESKEQQEQYKKVLQDLFQFDTEIRE